MLIDNTILILSSIGLFQGFFLSTYLITLKTGKRSLNIYLGLMLLGLTVRIGKSVLGYYIPLEAWQKNIGISGTLIVGPFLWLYGASILKKKDTPLTKFHIHLIPFAIFIALLPVIPSNGSFEFFWNYGIVVFHLALYLIVSWITLIKHYNTSNKSKLKWYGNMLIGVSIIWCYYLGNLLNFQVFYTWGPLFYVFLIYTFTYLFLNRNHFNLNKYDHSKLNLDESKILFKKIKDFIENEKAFLDHNFSIKKLSEILTTSSREISQAINENSNYTFREFVNFYRVENAKKILSNQKNKDKIATIAYDCGFGTVTSFNVAFKKIMNTTPSEFRKKNSL